MALMFTSIKELNEAIWQHLEKHNDLNFQGRNYSRKVQFDEMEKLALQSLPGQRFEMRKVCPGIKMGRSFILKGMS